VECMVLLCLGGCGIALEGVEFGSVEDLVVGSRGFETSGMIQVGVPDENGGGGDGDDDISVGSSIHAGCLGGSGCPEVRAGGWRCSSFSFQDGGSGALAFQDGGSGCPSVQDGGPE
jgi:hypothetical protein